MGHISMVRILLRMRDINQHDNRPGTMNDLKFLEQEFEHWTETFETYKARRVFCNNLKFIKLKSDDELTLGMEVESIEVLRQGLMPKEIIKARIHIGESLLKLPVYVAVIQIVKHEEGSFVKDTRFVYARVLEVIEDRTDETFYV